MATDSLKDPPDDMTTTDKIADDEREGLVIALDHPGDLAPRATRLGGLRGRERQDGPSGRRQLSSEIRLATRGGRMVDRLISQYTRGVLKILSDSRRQGCCC